MLKPTLVTLVLVLAMLGGCDAPIPELPDAASIDAQDTTVDLECTTSPVWPRLSSECGTGPAVHHVDSVTWWAVKRSHERAVAYTSRCGADDAAVAVCGEAPVLLPLPEGETANGDAWIACDVWLAFATSVDALQTWARCVVDNCPRGMCHEPGGV